MATTERLVLSRLEVLRQLERRIQEAGSLCGAARDLGISPQYLSWVLSGRRQPGRKVLNALGISKAPMYYIDRETA